MSNAIKLSLPLNPAYVSTIRLTSSSISERMNFNISEIEDIKTALSETATYIIKSCDPVHCSSFEVTFNMEIDRLLVEILIPSISIDFPAEPENISLMLIKGCMNKFEINKDSNKNITCINLEKVRE